MPFVPPFLTPSDMTPPFLGESDGGGVIEAEYLRIDNEDLFVVTSITHEMGKAARATFYRIGEDPDTTTPVPDRTEVLFVWDGIVWFYGRTLPARRVVHDGEEVLEYTAADPVEFLGNNPVANDGVGESEWYNRRAVDVTAYDWPRDQSVESILEAELASIVGASEILRDLVWTRAGAAKNLIPPEFQVKGKTWLGLIDALVNESPGLTYWYDPRDVTFSDTEVTGYGKLRFYDLSLAGLDEPRKIIRLARRDGAPDNANSEGVDITEDISQSYDTVRIHGLGDLTERYDEATPAWDPLDPAAVGELGPYLRHNQTTGRTEAFEPNGLGGQWLDEADMAIRPWFPESDAPGYKWVGRQFSLPVEIVDLRITRDIGSPATYGRDVQSMWVFSLQWVWYVGPLQWLVGSALHLAFFISDVRFGDFSGGTIDDDGSVKPNTTMYEDPVTRTEPRFGLPTPTGYDNAAGAGYFLAKEPLVRRTQYVFSGTADPDYTNLMNVPCFKYFPVYDYVWLKYTGSVPLAVQQDSPLLGYDKRLDLYDQRFFKYTNADGAVLVNDTAAMQAIANSIFALVSRRRVYGTAVVDAEPDTVLSDWEMGSLIQLANWGADGSTYDPPAAIQGFDLAGVHRDRRLTLRFDRPNTFLPMERYAGGHEFHEGNQFEAQSGLYGKRGDRLNPGDKPEFKKPKDDGGAGSLPSHYAPSAASEGPDFAGEVVVGKITSRSAPRAKGDVLTYGVSTLDASYTGIGLKPKLRQFSGATVLFAAAVDSACLLRMAPDETGGVALELLACGEYLHQWMCAGTVTARNASQGLPPALNYSWMTDDGVYTGTAAQPLYRPYNDAPLVLAAPVNSKCEVMITESSGGSPLAYSYTAQLWICQEKVFFEECVVGDSYSFLEGDQQFDPRDIVVSPTGDIIVDINGNVVVMADSATIEDHPESAIVTTGPGGEIVYDESYNAVVGDQPFVTPSYYDDLLISTVNRQTAVSLVAGLGRYIGAAKSEGTGTEAPDDSGSEHA